MHTDIGQFARLVYTLYLAICQLSVTCAGLPRLSHRRSHIHLIVLRRDISAEFKVALRFAVVSGYKYKKFRKQTGISEINNPACTRSSRRADQLDLRFLNESDILVGELVLHHELTPRW